MTTKTPRTDELQYRAQGCSFDQLFALSREIELELNKCHAAHEEQISVTFGQMQTIRELRAKLKDVAAQPNVES